MSRFNYLENDIGYGRNYGIDIKLDKFQTVCGAVHRILRNKVRHNIKLKFYKVMTIPVPSYGCELLTRTKKQDSKIQAYEMMFLRLAKTCSKLDRIKN